MAKEKEKAQHYYYYVVSVGAGENPVCDQFTSLEEVVVRLKQLVGKEAYAFVFRGVRGEISKGPHRYLRIPGAAPSTFELLPLFEQPSPDGFEEEQSGFVGEIDVDTYLEADADDDEEALQDEEEGVEKTTEADDDEEFEEFDEESDEDYESEDV